MNVRFPFVFANKLHSKCEFKEAEGVCSEKCTKTNKKMRYGAILPPTVKKQKYKEADMFINTILIFYLYISWLSSIPTYPPYFK